MKSSIPEELKVIVSKSVKLLGFAIQDVYGVAQYQVIEKLRLKMKMVRHKDPETVEKALNEVYLDLKGRRDLDLHQISKAFSLMLELINTCEASYRSHRLQDYKLTEFKKPHSLVFVFTSHPTEARSRNFLLLMDKVEDLLLKAYTRGFEEIEAELLHLLRMALKLNLANNRRPQVSDEAEQIFHFVLDASILSEQIALRKKGIDVFFRTWVGGDKDGHPKVGEATMMESLNLSRGKLIEFISTRLTEFKTEVQLVNKEIVPSINGLLRELKALKKIGTNDGEKLKRLRKNLTFFILELKDNKLASPGIADLRELLWLYPALVLPLEIREDHELIHEAIKKPQMAIAKMLSRLKRISKGLDSKWYVRGFVISMCQSADDVMAAVKLTKKMTGSFSLPVVPLFENEKGLSHSVAILQEAFSRFSFKDQHLKKWGGRFEVMLGYSDSSKESGVLPGRLLVESALYNLEKFLTKEGLVPVFFHGSGGSVSRGGGSVKEQIAWWPQSALNIYKVTIQGETVQRHFHQPLIMRSQVGKIVEEFSNYKPKKVPESSVIPKFAKDIQNRYMSLVQDPEFQDLVSKATPYDFLNLLKIGSRPTKRSGKGQFSIRAIPWILCWTQTRLLLPIWWGIGSSWESLSENEKSDLKQYYEASALLQSYVKNLGFTFAKIELGVWNFHVECSTLGPEAKEKWRKEITAELEKSINFFKEISGHKNFTWFRPMLGESIIFRSSMIHPLNVIQKLSLERKDNVLLREAVTGVASGMLTTG